jgi:hypothetical protein
VNFVYRREGDHIRWRSSIVDRVTAAGWYSEYDLDQLGNFNARLTELGVATWSLEYRRIGNPGGGWPGTDFAQKVLSQSAVADD